MGFVSSSNAGVDIVISESGFGGGGRRSFLVGNWGVPPVFVAFLLTRQCCVPDLFTLPSHVFSLFIQ